MQKAFFHVDVLHRYWKNNHLERFLNFNHDMFWTKV